MDICIDIGNSRTKIGWFEGDELIKSQVLDLSTELNDVTLENVDAAIISFSGVLPNHLLEHILDRIDAVIILDEQVDLPFNNAYKTPSTLGHDRKAGVAGACLLYPDEACLVIDAGTCITYDFINNENEYLGGNIAPGIVMRLEAMSDNTARLPLVKPIYNPSLLGTTTEEALQNGAIVGVLSEIEQYIAMLKCDFQNFKTILTGGDAQFLSTHVKREIFVHSDLVLIGLHKILSYNAENH